MSRIDKDLEWALEFGPFVRITRRRKKWDQIDGYVVGLSHGWVLVHRMADTFVLDGYEAVRRCDIRSVASSPGQDLPHQALTMRGFTRTPQPELDLSTLANLLLSSNALYPLVTVHLEESWSDICFIGVVDRVGKKNLHLKKLNPQARWIETEKFALDDITRVAFGGGYEDALWRVAQDIQPGRCEKRLDDGQGG